MERGARVVIRDAVLTTLLALLLVLSVSVSEESHLPAAAATSSAPVADQPAADAGPGPAPVLAVPASRCHQSHRADSPTPALPRVVVGTPRSSAPTDVVAAPGDRPHSVTRLIPDGRAPPA
jgi:hypothetical protein